MSQLLDTLGYHVSDMGALVRARDIENIPLSLFINWRQPLALSLSIWCLLYMLTFARYNLCHDNMIGWYPDNLAEMFSKYINKTCNIHALALLGLCYLPGQ